LRSSEISQILLSRFGINVVRGLAASLVLFLHVSSLIIPQEVWINKIKYASLIFPWVFRGEVGVGVLIFLSGFLLTLNSPSTKQQWVGFYIRRFSRIYPVYIILLLIAISVTRQWDFPGFINALFLFPNFPGTLWPYPYLSTAWSLGIEWTLYLLFPFLLFSIKLKFQNVIFICLIFQIIIFYGNLAGTDFHTLVYGSILGRIIQFILGIAMAIKFEYFKLMSLKKLLPLIFFGYIFFHLWCYLYLEQGGAISESYLRMLQPLAESVFAAVLIILSQRIKSKNLHTLLKPLSYIGVISYPLYLTHMIMLDGVKRINIASEFLDLSILGQSALFITLSIFLAWIIHISIEKPGMILGRRISKFF